MHPNYDDLLNNLHYFYSTVPQVLGAILAITGAFVVFKLDSLKRTLFGRTQKLIDNYSQSKIQDLEKEFKPNALDDLAKEGVKKGLFVTHLKANLKDIKYAQIEGDIDKLKEIFESKKSDIDKEFRELKSQSRKESEIWYIKGYE